MQQWIIGVLLAALASIISNFGLNLQKLCHIRNEKNQTNISSGSELSSVPLRRKRRRLRPLKKQRETPLLQDATVSDTSTQIQIISPHGHITPVNGHGHVNGNGTTTPRTSIIGRTPMNGLHPPGLTPTNLDGDRHYSQSITSSSSFALQINDDDFTSPSFNVALNDTPTAMRAGAGRGSMSMPPNIVPATPASALSAVAEAVHGSSHPHSHPSSNHSLASADPSNLVPSPSFVTVEPPRKVNYVKQPLWQLGLAAVIGGSLLDFVALGFAAQSVIAPLGSLTLVSNSFFAPLLLKEKISRRDMAATAAIVAGSSISVIFASHQESTITVSELFKHFKSARFLVYGTLVAIGIIIGYLCIRKFDAIKKRSSMEYTTVSKYHRFAYAACAGTMGAQSVLFAKCTAELIANSIKGDDLLFVYWQSYFVLLGLGLTIFFQIRWLNAGLRHFDALYIVPVFQSFWILISVVSGMIFFGEYQDVFTHTTNSIMFPLGILLTIVGVFFLSQRGVTSQAAAPDGSLPDSPVTGSANPISRSRATSSAILTPFLIDLPEPDDPRPNIGGRILSNSDADRGSYVPLDLHRTVSGHSEHAGLPAVDSYSSMIDEGEETEHSYSASQSTYAREREQDEIMTESPSHRLSPSVSQIEVRGMLDHWTEEKVPSPHANERRSHRYQPSYDHTATTTATAAMHSSINPIASSSSSSSLPQSGNNTT